MSWRIPEAVGTVRFVSGKSGVLEAFVYRGAIDQGTYQQQLDKLEVDLDLVEICCGWTRTKRTDCGSRRSSSRRGSPGPPEHLEPPQAGPSSVS
jgi:hypothetical protein